MRNFRNLKIWINAMQITTNVYLLVRKLPHEERLELSSQIRRSSVSIPSNIAEGSSRTSAKERAHYVEIAIGSAFELETQLLIAKNIGYLTEQEVESQVMELSELQKSMNRYNEVIRNDSVRKNLTLCAFSLALLILILLCQ